MTPRQIDLVRASWAAAQPIADTVVRLFYRRLFELAPEARRGIRTSMSQQGDSVYDAAEAMVAALTPAGVEALRGATGQAVIDAWVWALKNELGRRCLKETCTAWRTALAERGADDFHAVALGATEAIAA